MLQWMKNKQAELGVEKLLNTAKEAVAETTDKAMAGGAEAWGGVSRLTSQAVDGVGSLGSEFSQKGGELIEQHWPAIENLLVNGLLDIAEEKLRDDVFLEDVLRRLYAPLPLPVRFVVSEGYFVSSMMGRKTPLLRLVAEKKSDRMKFISLEGPKVE